MISLFRKKTAFRSCASALFVSGIGTGLTSIVVYAELERRGASHFYYALAFVLGVLPGMITSGIAGRFGGRCPLLRWIFLSQAAGAVLLALPAWGLAKGNLPMLVLAECLGSAISGLLAPVYQGFLRRQFTDAELPTVTRFETLAFAANFLLAQVAGTLLYGLLGRQLYLLLDWLSYGTAIVLVARASAVEKDAFLTEGRATPSFDWRSLTEAQRRVFFFLPLLSLVCAPLMALLPAVGARFSSAPVSAALLYLLARGLGQLAGPWLAACLSFDHLLADTRLLIFSLGGFWLLYAFVFNTSSIGWAMVAIVLAHCFSNVVYAAGSYGLTKSFDAEVLPAVAARHYQLCILAVSASALFAGLCSHFASLNAALVLSLLGWMFWCLHLHGNAIGEEPVGGVGCHVV